MDAETDGSDRRLLFRELERVIAGFLEVGRSIYLERFGIIFPRTTNQSKTYIWDNCWVIRSETVRSIHFEKCVDLTSIDLSNLGADGPSPGTLAPLVELPELAATIYPKLPLKHHIRWSESRFRFMLRGLIEFLRLDVISRGYTDLLAQVGMFYALHNRQGDTPGHWFAGCDLFLQAREDECLVVGPCRFVNRPVLERASELFEAHFGAPIIRLTCDVRSELRKLGYEDHEMEIPGDQPTPSFAVLGFTHQVGDESRLLFCSEGLRKLALGQDGARGTEFTFQLAWSEEPPRWVLGLFALGWLVLRSIPGAAINGAKVFSSEAALFRGKKREVRHILASAFELVRAPQLSEQGEFTFINLVAVTDSEYQVAERYAPSFLLDLLRARGLDQVTKLDRRCIASRTGLVESDLPAASNNADLRNTDEQLAMSA